MKHLYRDFFRPKDNWAWASFEARPKLPDRFVHALDCSCRVGAKMRGPK